MVRLTNLQYQGSNTVASGDYQLIRTVGNFTKAEAGTTIKVTWSAHAEVATAGQFCEWALRVDGKTSRGTTAVTYDGTFSGRTVQYASVANDRDTVSAFAYFPGLGAGTHAAQIWVRGFGTTCTLNPGNFGQDMIVEEINLP